MKDSKEILKQPEETISPGGKFAVGLAAAVMAFCVTAGKAEAKVQNCGPATPLKNLPVLYENDTGPCVGYFQQLLRRHEGSYPNFMQVRVDNRFGQETRGRTVGFQIQNNIKGDDGYLGTGNVGRRTWAAVRKPTSFHGIPQVCREIESGACVSKRQNRTRLIRNGKVFASYASRFGDARSIADRTDEGVFDIDRKEFTWTSTVYGGQMNRALFYNGGEALHHSPRFEAEGWSGASHGCVNLRLSAANNLFRVLKIGDPVVVY